MNEIVFTYRGQVERGNGRGGYDWRDGYSETGPKGEVSYPWLTHREAQAQARQAGAVARFAYPKHADPIKTA